MLHSTLEHLHALASAAFVVAAYLVFFSIEIIDSVLALIMSFFYAFFLTLLTNKEYLAYLFIIIYVGAIAILFLFIIMMIDIKRTTAKLFFGLLQLSIAIFISALLYNMLMYCLVDVVDTAGFTHTVVRIDRLSEIYNFSQALFGYNSILVLLAGIVLLIAMIGAVTLTKNLNDRNTFNNSVSETNEKKKSKTNFMSLFSDKKDTE
jgi:NADH-quinone oxidoreductase subunit J